MFAEVYVNTFGVGAPLVGLPVYAVLDLFVDIEHDRFWWWHGAALTASLLTALAALFVFLAARGFVEPVPAALIALAFGLGSCVWPFSSEITKRDIPGLGGAPARLRVPGCVPLVGSTDEIWAGTRLASTGVAAARRTSASVSSGSGRPE